MPRYKYAEDLPRLKKLISRFKRAKVLVIGDIILDQFIWGNVERISPEAPVPVVWVTCESFTPGGAANVANNIHALGGRVALCGVIGNDTGGSLLREELKKKSIDIGGIVIDGHRPTTLKTRIIASHQQLLRVDKEEVASLEDNLIEQILTSVREKIKEIDGIVIEDYGKGLIVPRLLSEVVGLAKRFQKIITVDPKINHFSYYKGVTAITPNHYEAEAGSGVKIQNSQDIDRAGRKLLEELGAEGVLVTLGENGMRLFQKNKKPVHIPTVAQEVFDVTGAGDTVISCFSLALISGATMSLAAKLANFAAGIVVGKVGVGVVTQEELLEGYGT
jgi:D-beta-D-heptose 7-phosphate kinase/D-beta-D-heptose 1-phosphate adenosyltransferase